MPGRRPAALAASLALTLVVTACSGGGGTPAPASGGSSAAPSASGAAPRPGGEAPRARRGASARPAGNTDIIGAPLAGGQHRCKQREAARRREVRLQADPVHAVG